VDSFAVDPNIQWERTSSWDAGLDLGLAGQRLSGSLDWYARKTTGLLLAVPVSAGGTFTNYLVTNADSLRNQGVELSVRAHVLDGGPRGLGWTAEFVASHNANKLLNITSGAVVRIPTGAISGGVGNTIQVLQPGQPVDAFYVFKQKYDASGKPLEGQYEDLNSDGVVNSGDLRPFHSPLPSLELDHTSRFTYRAWDLGLTLRAWLGNYVYDNLASQGAWQALTGGASPSNVSASVLRTGFVAPQYLSDYFVENASFLRLDAVALGYSFRSGGRRLRLFVAVQSAFTITGYRGVDPSAGLSGIETDAYPHARTVTGGVNVRL
jgi:iron complex outermembrane receptor protein